jgi:branched-chain amino acid transport system substrate-binding protein
MRLLRGVAATVLVGCAVAACGDSEETGEPSSAAKTSEPVVIGFAGGTTGFLEFYDAPVKAGAEIAIEEINAAGGVAGRKLELIARDNKSDTSQIVPTALALLDQDVDILMPTCDYDLGGPAAREAGKAGKLAIGCAGGPLYGRQGIGPLLFNTMAGTPTEAAAMAEFAKARGWAKPYLLQDTSLEYSKTICDYFKASWTQLGGTLAGEDTFQNSDASLGSQVTRLKGAGADAVILCSYPPGGAAAVKQIRDAGLDAPIIGPSAFDGTYWLEGIPDLSNFYNVANGSVHGDDPSAERRAFFETFEAKTGKPPISSVYPAMGYAAIQTVAKALEQTKGDASGAALAKAIEGFKDTPLITGATTYAADCHIPVGRPLVVVEIQNGKAAFVEEVKPTQVPKAPC